MVLPFSGGWPTTFSALLLGYSCGLVAGSREPSPSATVTSAPISPSVY
ncbi:hypothetical protein ACFFX0_22960 [Citricoccus parietis]|uniref:Uncharacterized protein n=1 Tax=Citricoccus parietis TaxID=592307 RepID=A0ABV5G4R7_9MICC